MTVIPEETRVWMEKALDDEIEGRPHQHRYEYMNPNLLVKQADATYCRCGDINPDKDTVWKRPLPEDFLSVIRLTGPAIADGHADMLRWLAKAVATAGSLDLASVIRAVSEGYEAGEEARA